MKKSESLKMGSLDSLQPNELFYLFLHQDNMLWNRLQTIGVIQIGVLSSAYGLGSKQLLSLSILVLGIILTAVIFFLLKRDERIRMKIEYMLDRPDFGVPRVWYSPLKGREATWIITIILLLTDLMLCLLIILDFVP